jgi:DHA1 family bicyclomycin/chloramphenicol resistance-like MFS transporter
MSAAVPSRASMTPSIVVVALTLLLGIQPVATDVYLPALPTIVTALGTTVSAAQLTLSALVIAFGMAQLVCGPLSDRFGRRPVLLTGLALYTAASVASTLAPDIDWLIAMRVLQGAAMAAAVTCGRSVIRDLFEPHEGARVMARALTGLGCIAIAAPIIGSTTVAFIGWRASIAATALFGLCAFAFCALQFKETIAIKNARATQPGPLLRTWRTIVTDRTFTAYALLGAFTYIGLFLVLVGSSFVYIDVLGLTRLEYGAIMTVNSICYTLGTVACRRLLARRGLRGTVALAGGLSLVSGVALAGFSWAGWHTVLAIAVPQWAYSMAHGIHQPCSQAGAIGPFPKSAGTAAALSGFVMMAAAFASGLVYAHAQNASVYPLTLGVGAAGVAVAFTAWTLVQRHGEPRTIPDVLPEPA